MRLNKPQLLFTYIVLGIWSLIVLFPIWTLVVNSFKPQKQIFKDPFGLPETFTLDGYREAWNNGRFDLYFINTLIVTAIALGLILFIGSMARAISAAETSRNPLRANRRSAASRMRCLPEGGRSAVSFEGRAERVAA